VQSLEGLNSGKFQPCPQILDKSGSEWKWQYTPAYYDMASIMAVKSFIVPAPGITGVKRSSSICRASVTKKFYNIEPGDGGCVVEVGPHRHDDVVGGVVLGLANYRPSLFKVHLH